MSFWRRMFGLEEPAPEPAEDEIPGMWDVTIKYYGGAYRFKGTYRHPAYAWSRDVFADSVSGIKRKVRAERREYEKSKRKLAEATNKEGRYKV